MTLEKKSDFDLHKNREIWLNNWQNVFKIWRFIPGFLYFPKIRKCIPDFFTVKYNIFHSLNDEKRFLVVQDSLQTFLSSEINFLKLSLLEKQNFQFLNSFYILNILNIKNNDFFNGPYVWQSSLSDAKGVLANARYYTSIYELVKNNFFTGDLNLHKSLKSLINQNPDYFDFEINEINFIESNFYKSNLTQKEYFDRLEMSNWDYNTFVLSAIFFVLGSIFRESQLKNQDSLVKNRRFFTRNYSIFF